VDQAWIIQLRLSIVLRLGKAHAAAGLRRLLRPIVRQIRALWPEGTERPESKTLAPQARTGLPDWRQMPLSGWEWLVCNPGWVISFPGVRELLRAVVAGVADGSHGEEEMQSARSPPGFECSSGPPVPPQGQRFASISRAPAARIARMRRIPCRVS
jgi:hypothetical protein